MFSDLSRHLINCGKIGLAALLGRRPDTDENGITRADSFACVGCIENAACLSCRRQNFFQVVLVDRNLSGQQALDAVRIDIRACYFMARGGKARAGYKSNVATPDHR